MKYLYTETPQIVRGVMNGNQYFFSNHKFDIGDKIVLWEDKISFDINKPLFNGKAPCEFEIGDVLELTYKSDRVDYSNQYESKITGYGLSTKKNLKYAYEIKNLIVYGYDFDSCHYNCEECDYRDKIKQMPYPNCNKPTTPLIIDKFRIYTEKMIYKKERDKLQIEEDYTLTKPPKVGEYIKVVMK